ncbi:MAG TPA: hypothetical protein VGQ69_06585 [Gemmatimonadales bacterium]|jgi:hypothetical protein|nr:hypothetical protein [Gemmatimonadales bacterium]
MSALLGLSGYQWLLLLAALQAVLLSADSFIGHYRSGFALRAQYAPFLLGTLLLLSALAAAIAPAASGVARVAVGAGLLAFAAGLIGAGYHHWYGITTKPGGYRWLLHHLLHHAPPLAPLVLATAGGLEALAALGVSGTPLVLGAPIRTLVLGVVSLTLFGMSLSAGLLHYRGAYNNPLMYLPVVLLPLAAAAAGWNALAPASGASRTAATALLWLTFLSGFLGAGMHLRGMDRQMGGLAMGVAAILDAPPPAAPLLVAAVGASGLIAVRLL